MHICPSAHDSIFRLLQHLDIDRRRGLDLTLPVSTRNPADPSLVFFNVHDIHSLSNPLNSPRSRRADTRASRPTTTMPPSSSPTYQTAFLSSLTHARRSVSSVHIPTSPRHGIGSGKHVAILRPHDSIENQDCKSSSMSCPYGLHLHPCRFIGYLVAFVETRDVVDAASLEIDSAVLPRVDMSAEHETRTLL